MSETSVLQVSDFADICRTCLIRKIDMTSIHVEHVSTMVRAITNIEISKDDRLPVSICEDCREQIRRSFDFRTLCEKSDETLREVLRKADIEPELTITESTADVEIENDVRDDDSDDAKSDAFDAIFEPRSVKSERRSITSVRVQRALGMGLDKCDPATSTCKICDRVLVNIYSLGRHMETHDERREFRHSCDACGKGFYERSQLTKHARRHRGETRYKCESCPKAFYELSALASHAKKHGTEPITCDVCNREFYVRQQFDAHAKTHSADAFECAECGKIFRTAKYLQSHRLVHVKVRAFPCLSCDKSFKDDSALKNHRRRMHDAAVVREPDVCAVCGKAVKLLARHMLRHGGDRPHACTRCPRAFVRKCDLDEHVRARHRDATSVEPRPYPYLCAECGKRCASTTQLRVHTRAHTGERPFACRMCDKRYRTNFLLTAHVRSHTEERPFVCDVCRKGFYTKHVLKCHARTHTGERPYTCKICARAFTQNSALKTHMKIH